MLNKILMILSFVGASFSGGGFWVSVFALCYTTIPAWTLYILSTLFLIIGVMFVYYGVVCYNDMIRMKEEGKNQE